MKTEGLSYSDTVELELLAGDRDKVIICWAELREARRTQGVLRSQSEADRFETAVGNLLEQVSRVTNTRPVNIRKQEKEQSPLLDVGGEYAVDVRWYRDGQVVSVMRLPAGDYIEALDAASQSALWNELAEDCDADYTEVLVRERASDETRAVLTSHEFALQLWNEAVGR